MGKLMEVNNKTPTRITLLVYGESKVFADRKQFTIIADKIEFIDESKKTLSEIFNSRFGGKNGLTRKR